MKTSIKLALAVFAAAGIAAPPLAAFADDATPEGGNNCSNMRTTTNSRCVHYNEKQHDGYANQHANDGKASTGSSGRGSTGTVTVLSNPDASPYFAGTAHVNYNDIISGKAGVVRGNGGSGGSRGGTSAR